MEWERKRMPPSVTEKKLTSVLSWPWPRWCPISLNHERRGRSSFFFYGLSREMQCWPRSRFSRACNPPLTHGWRKKEAASILSFCGWETLEVYVGPAMVLFCPSCGTSLTCCLPFSLILHTSACLVIYGQSKQTYGYAQIFRNNNKKLIKPTHKWKQKNKIQVITEGGSTYML